MDTGSHSKHIFESERNANENRETKKLTEEKPYFLLDTLDLEMIFCFASFGRLCDLEVRYGKSVHRGRREKGKR